jgi:hypothetical protein
VSPASQVLYYRPIRITQAARVLERATHLTSGPRSHATAQSPSATQPRADRPTRATVVVPRDRRAALARLEQRDTAMRMWDAYWAAREQAVAV